MTEGSGRFCLSDEQSEFKKKAGDLFSALSDVNFSPSLEADSFLKTDPIPAEGDRSMSRISRRKMHQGCGTSRSHQSSKAGRSESTAMPPPMRPAVKRRRNKPVPRYLEDASKYTEYSLSDVPAEQLSQKSNTAAAFEFLRELDQRQSKAETDDTDPPEGGKIMFKKPVKGHKAVPKKPVYKAPVLESDATVPMDSSSEPEPEGDQATPSLSVPKGNSRKSKKASAIKLSHLEYEDED